MPTKPKIVTLTNSSVDVLNAIRNYATTNYQDYVPVATNDPESIRTIGAVIMDNPSLQNEFVSALVNRIGRVLVTSKMYKNPWSVFKRGMLELGETIEEVFVDIATPFQYDPAVAEQKVFARNIPDVRSSFYPVNYQKYYKNTVSREQLKAAFLSWDGVTDLITKIVQSMYTAANYDEYQVCKYMLCRRILSGLVYPVQLETPNDTPAVVTKVKAVSNNFEFMSDKYNLAGVHNVTPKQEQYILVDSRFDAAMSVEVLATAFNMDKAEFMGHRILCDGFGELDNKRLAILFEGDDTYKEITPEERTSLNNIPAVLVDKDYFVLCDSLNETDSMRNPEGTYWNYWLHTWKIFGVSPFSQCCVFVPGKPAVTSVTVTPGTASASVGQTVSFSCVVETDFYAPQSVVWSVSNDDMATVTKSGTVTILDSASGNITVTATSVFDNTKKGNATITVS